MAYLGELTVGMLYLGTTRNGLPVWSQPVPGGPVYPQLPSQFSWFKPDSGIYKWPANYAAQYFFGCGHPLNVPEIYSAYDPYTQVRNAIVCCPMCSYIQQILPWAEYEDNQETPLVVA